MGLPAVNRHGPERIIELCAILAAHAIRSSANCEDTAEISAVTAK